MWCVVLLLAMIQSDDGYKLLATWDEACCKLLAAHLQLLLLHIVLSVSVVAVAAAESEGKIQA
jgi:hypothetical protein